MQVFMHEHIDFFLLTKIFSSGLGINLLVSFDINTKVNSMDENK